MTQTRRAVLLGSTALALAACAGQQPPQQQWLVDLGDLVAVLIKDFPALFTMGAFLPGNVLSAISGAMPLLEQIRAMLPNITATTDVGALVARLLPLLVQILGPAAAILGATTHIGMALIAASALLPVLARIFGIAMPAQGPRFARPAMSVDEARAILAARAHE